MRYVIAIALLTLSICLSAQIGMNMNTPEGSVSMQITGLPTEAPARGGSIMDQIVARLDRLEKEIHSKLTKIDQKKAEKIVDDIYALLALLPDAPMPAGTSSSSASASSSSSSSSSSSASATGNVNINMNITGMDNQQPKPKPHVHDEPEQSVSTRKLMPETEFTALMAKINKESFADDKLRVLRTAAKSYKFNCNQIVRLIGAQTFSEDKLEALRISYPEVVDPRNNFKILDAFTYSSDKDEAEDIMN